jgi:hypothetical protein
LISRTQEGIQNQWTYHRPKVYPIEYQGTLYNYADDNTLSYGHPDFNVLTSVLESESNVLINWFKEKELMSLTFFMFHNGRQEVYVWILIVEIEVRRRTRMRYGDECS